MNAYNFGRRTYRRRYCLECEHMFWYDTDTGIFYEQFTDVLEPTMRCDCGIPLTLMHTSSVQPIGTFNLTFS